MRKITAKEILQLYAEGRGNFRGVGIRGQSFKGKDLSGADFSRADMDKEAPMFPFKTRN